MRFARRLGIIAAALCAVAPASRIAAQSNSQREGTWPGSRLCYADTSMMVHAGPVVLAQRFTLQDVRVALADTAPAVPLDSVLNAPYAAARASCQRIATQVAVQMGKPGVELLIHALASDRGAGLDSAFRGVGSSPVPLLDSVATHAADALVRARALSALAAIGPPAAGAVSSIAAGLNDRAPAVQIAAARAAYSVSPGDPRLLSGLVSVLKNAQDDPARVVALGAISRYDSTTGAAAQNAVVHMLAGGDSVTIPAAMVALTGNRDARAETGPVLSGIGSATADPVVIATLFDSSSARGISKSALASLLAGVRPFPASEFRMLLLRPRSARWALLDALKPVGTDALPLIPVLLRTASDSDFSVRLSSAHAMIALLPSANPADARSMRSRLLGMLDDADPRVSEEVAPVIAHFLPADSSIVLMGRRMLHDPARDRAGVLGLAAIGAPAVPLLITAARNPSSVVRAHAMDALGDIGDVTTIPVLIAGLGDTAQYVRLLAAINLALFRHEAASALPALRAHIRDPDGEVRSAVIDAIRAISPQ